MRLSHSMGAERAAMTGVLLRDILGARFDEMPESVQRMHDIDRRNESG